ncbi:MULTISPECIES: hypothetical protein [unclassified Moorena]|uniref:hypothetical protein n=1 Tax=unclassified Moorena TaxID=2683338 RepID=UPI0013BAF7D8|nr:MULTISPECIES: hypothetical protein [unclassified Moorena]NER91204.1 hypothetical protein [Moorena sp. SIO3A2]NES41886.1 hypothetical protein [Moorena sp. SIO2C4]
MFNKTNKTLINDITVELNKLFSLESVNLTRLINIEIRHNSFILLFEISKKQNVYVKIINYKTSSLSKAIKNHDSISKGLHEYNSLLWINKNLNFLTNINTIEPITYLSKFNAIVTKEIISFQLYKNLHYQNIETTLFSIGSWLYEFHQKQGYEYTFVSQADSLLEQIDIEYKEILQGSYTPQNISFGIGLNNFDIRDVLINKNDVYLLDLNTTHEIVPHLQDVGRFLASLELAYWGTAKFGIKTVPKSLANAFLDGYCYQQKSKDLRKTANWFAARYIFKHITRNNKRINDTNKIYLKGYYQLFAKPYLEKIVQNKLLP